MRQRDSDNSGGARLVAGAMSGRSAQRGFTLVEAVATMVIIATLGSIAAVVVAQASEAYTSAATMAQLQSELSAGLDRVERAVRGIRRKAGADAPDITGCTASSISWDAAGGPGSLSVAGGELLLAENGGAGAAILSGVSWFAVECFDGAGVALPADLSGPACEPIRRVVVTVTVERAGVTTTLRSGVFLRSTMAGAP